MRIASGRGFLAAETVDACRRQRVSEVPEGADEELHRQLIAAVLVEIAAASKRRRDEIAHLESRRSAQALAG